MLEDIISLLNVAIDHQKGVHEMLPKVRSIGGELFYQFMARVVEVEMERTVEFERGMDEWFNETPGPRARLALTLKQTINVFGIKSQCTI